METYNKDIENRKEIKETRIRLEEEIKQEKKQGMNEINERERAKINAVRKLTQEMDYKVIETQANLMALNDEQL